MKKLIIAPHVDDEVLGCGGILDDDTFVLHCGLAENQNHGDKFFSSAERMVEWNRVENATGCQSRLLDHDVNNFFFGSKLIGDIEKIINEIKPSIVYLPSPSYNQDHQAVYKSAIVALRPHDCNHFVNKIVLYEQPQDFWNGAEKPIIPNYFVSIDIEKKLHLYSLLASQVRGHRSPEMLRNLASMRGNQSNKTYAEAFQIVRWVE